MPDEPFRLIYWGIKPNRAVSRLPIRTKRITYEPYKQTMHKNLDEKCFFCTMTSMKHQKAAPILGKRI